ncbi:hypothetical protein ACQEPB_00300 [Novosphingobium fluoreni]|uniref:hypothetical protein n=1 Tax=Novosphingobium fluoreni TaxID=1391222 RepID=UPI003DA15885
MPDRKYVACKFRSTDTRSFTYHYDGEEPLQVGDTVKVPDRSGDGWKRVEVVVIGDEMPAFPTKGIIGLYNPDAEAAEAATKPGPLDLGDDAIVY